MLFSGQPDDPSLNCINLTGSLTQFKVSGGSKVAAGPSTCGDWIVVPHHRTTGAPGQGVDVRLLCPVTNNLVPAPPSGGLFAIGSGCGKTPLAARALEFSNDGSSNLQKTETRLVTAGRDSKPQKG